MNPNRWERNLTKGLNDQKNEMKEWIKKQKNEWTKDWNFGMIEWMDERIKRRKEWMSQKNDIKEILRNSNFEIWVYSDVEFLKCWIWKKNYFPTCTLQNSLSLSLFLQN
jgi:hypothetical protein